MGGGAWNKGQLDTLVTTIIECRLVQKFVNWLKLPICNRMAKITSVAVLSLTKGEN